MLDVGRLPTPFAQKRLYTWVHFWFETVHRFVLMFKCPLDMFALWISRTQGRTRKTFWVARFAWESTQLKARFQPHILQVSCLYALVWSCLETTLCFCFFSWWARLDTYTKKRTVQSDLLLGLPQGWFVALRASLSVSMFCNHSRSEQVPRQFWKWENTSCFKIRFSSLT